MVCNLTRPDAQTLFNRYRDLFQNTVLGGATVIPESNEWYAVSLNYALGESFYAISEQAWKERDPRQACAENLIAMAADDGVFPRAAVSAQGYLKLTGLAGTALPNPLEFTVDGETFLTAHDATQPAVLDATGTAVVRVRATVPGSNGNLTAATGDLVTAVADVNTQVEVCGGSFCNGTDTEDAEAFRARYLRRLQHNPRATNQWIRDKVLEWPCVTRVITRAGTCCVLNCEPQGVTGASADASCEDCGCAECGGAMQFYVMFDGSFDNGIAPSSVLFEIEEWLFGSPQGYGMGQVEIGICGRIVGITPAAVDISIDIDDCPTGVDFQQVNDIVTEFFTTVEPSRAVNTAALSSTIERTLGLGINTVDVNFQLQDSSLAYGPGIGPAPATGGVYVTDCFLEPDCDIMVTEGSTTITQSASTLAGCQ